MVFNRGETSNGDGNELMLQEELAYWKLITTLQTLIPAKGGTEEQGSLDALMSNSNVLMIIIANNGLVMLLERNGIITQKAILQLC